VAKLFLSGLFGFGLENFFPGGGGFAGWDSGRRTVIEPGYFLSDPAQADGPILMLAPLLLAADPEACGAMSQTDGAVGCIDMLSPLPAGAKGFDPAFIKQLIIGDRQNSHN
jgi:hypothetical protein